MSQAMHVSMIPVGAGSAALAADKHSGVDEPSATVVVALSENRDADAARQFLHALQVHALGSDDLLSALRERGGDKAVERLVLAFATFGCPLCRGGFNTCGGCAGGGHAEERRNACQTCGGLGAAACDFCGGSGFCTYGFVPAALRASVAATRTDLAAQRVARHVRRALPTNVSRDELGVLRKALAKQLLELQRDVAILANAAQFAREFRAASPRSRPFTGRLFATASRHAKAARRQVVVVLGLLSKISRELASLAADPDAAAFENERAASFDHWSGDAARSAGRRSTLFPGR